MKDTIAPWAPIVISLVSLILSGVALGWNVYRDVILKARVKVSVAVVHLVSPGQRVGDGGQFIKIGVTNHGPGPVRVEMIVGKEAPFWRRLLRRSRHFVILPDYTNPLNPKLPHKMEVGDTITLLLPYNEISFLNGRATHIGVSDSCGRSHFASRSHLSQARAQFVKDFPKAIERAGP